MGVPADLSFYTITLSVATAFFSGPDHSTGATRGPLNDLPGISEQDLILRLRNDDHTAFEIIYRALHPRLLAIAQGYVQSTAIAEELAQDALLIVWDRRHQWKETDSLVVYLYATVRNHALKHRRHDGVVGRVEFITQTTGESIGTGQTIVRPDEWVEQEDLLMAVNRVLRSLPDTQQTAFTLRWLHQLEYDDIAAIMGMSSVAVRKQVSRARSALIAIVTSLTSA